MGGGWGGWVGGVGCGRVAWVGSRRVVWVGSRRVVWVGFGKVGGGGRLDGKCYKCNVMIQCVIVFLWPYFIFELKPQKILIQCFLYSFLRGGRSCLSV